jgi:ribosome-associated toxin RatA of RatAB toxin-antitoxin module
MLRLLRFVLILLLLAQAAWVRAATVKVDVDRTFDLFTIQARAQVPVNALTAWAVLTDYNNIARFVPDMTVSRVVSAPGQPLLLEQKGDKGMLNFIFPEEVVLRVDESSPRLIKFRSVSGTVRSMTGEWRVQERTGGVEVSYFARIRAGRPVPPLLSEALIKDNLEAKIKAVAREMERRHSAGR